MNSMLLALLLVLSIASPAVADLFICGDASTFRGHRFADPSTPPTCPPPYALSRVPEDQTAAQQALIDAFAHQKYYLKIVGTAPNGLVTEKTPAEKADADAAILAKQQEHQQYEEAATNNDLCNATLDQLAAAKTTLQENLQGDIDGISNIATAKTELADMMTRLVNAMDKLMRCIRGRAGPPLQP
jgi:hypothetical protein